MKIKKTAIVGMGFMGGSLAIALKKEFPQMDVWGYARSEQSWQRVNHYLPDRVERDLERLVKDADLIVFALPVFIIVEYFQKIAPFIKKGAIVCDLASSKVVIEKAAKKYLPKGIKFVGCHPLCGTEKSGIEYADSNLYSQAVCVITSLATRKQTQTVSEMWKTLGMKVKFINAKVHDELLSSFSHLPHAISFSLVKATSIPLEHIDLLPSSWKSLTRIAQSPANVWADIFLSNKKNILKDIKAFQAALKELSGVIKSGEKDKVEQLIKQINKTLQIN